MAKIGFIFIFVTTLFVSGCTDKTIGISARTHALLNADSGRSKVVLKHLIIEYKYKINHDIIAFDGTVTCNPKTVTDWDYAEIDMTIHFIDKYGTIIQNNNFSTIDDEDFCKPKPFIAEYKMPLLDVKGISFSYQVNMRQ